MRGPLSEIAMKALERTQRRAERNGLSLFEELNRVGLIASEPRIYEIRVAAVSNLRDRLEELDLHSALAGFYQGNSNPPTPDDVRRQLLAWVDRYIGLLG